MNRTDLGAIGAKFRENIPGSSALFFFFICTYILVRLSCIVLFVVWFIFFRHLILHKSYDRRDNGSNTQTRKEV